MTGDLPADPEIKDDYYQTHFLDYHAQTFHIDPSSFLEPLAKYLKPGDRILDVGCGSGRDLLWFKNRGFNPTGLERSDGLAQLARDHSGCSVITADFETFDFSTLQVDAVLLAGSLVHVPHEKLAGVLARIIQALRPDGVVLVTLKEGKGVKTLPEGRVFYLWDDNDLQALFVNFGFTRVDFSRQISKIRKDDVWLGYVLQKTS